MIKQLSARQKMLKGRRDSNEKLSPRHVVGAGQEESWRYDGRLGDQ